MLNVNIFAHFWELLDLDPGIQKCKYALDYIDYRTRANKGRGFKSKLLFDTMHYGPFYRNLSNFTTFICTKFGKTHLFLAISKGALLFKSVRYWRGYGKSITFLFQKNSEKF